MTEFSILEMMICVCLNIVRKGQEWKITERKKAKNKEHKEETFEILFEGHIHCTVASHSGYTEFHWLTDTDQIQILYLIGLETEKTANEQQFIKTVDRSLTCISDIRYFILAWNLETNV